jgi:hypothetical protein
MQTPVEAHGLIDKKTILDVSFYLMPDIKYTFLGLGFAYLYMLVTLLFNLDRIQIQKLSPYMIIYLFYIFIPVIGYTSIRKQTINKELNTIRESYHTDKLDYSLFFLEEKVSITYNNVKLCNEIEYSHFKKIIDLETIYLFITKNRNAIIVEKDSLINITKQEWVEFLKSKCTNVKKIKVKRRIKIPFIDSHKHNGV